jgi:hypothetical protein
LPICNTDQGSQFTGAAFTRVLANNGIAISMDGKGAWRDNVFVERLWRSVKHEEVYLRAYDSVSEGRALIGGRAHRLKGALNSPVRKRRRPKEAERPHPHGGRTDGLLRRRNSRRVLVRSARWSWLKAWAMQIARRRGMKKAIVALARRLAVIMHRIWVDGTEFRWTREQATAAA